MDFRKITEETIKRRIWRRLPLEFLSELGIEVFWVAGGALNRAAANDIDLFLPKGYEWPDLTGADVVSATKNAVTVRDRKTGMNVQLCNYTADSLGELVESFDFAHIKLGAEVEIFPLADRVLEIYISEDWYLARSMQTTWFTGSEYPLSSLVRLFKYRDRNEFSGRSWMLEMFRVLTAIMKRGMKDYEDFKDQLDAVDLGLLPEELEEAFSEWNDTHGLLLELYQQLSREAESDG